MMGIKWKMRINLNVFCLTAGYMISTEYRLMERLADLLTLQGVV